MSVAITFTLYVLSPFLSKGVEKLGLSIKEILPSVLIAKSPASSPVNVNVTFSPSGSFA